MTAPTTLDQFVKQTKYWCDDKTIVVAVDRRKSSTDTLKVTTLPLSGYAHWLDLPGKAVSEIEQIGVDTCCNNRVFPICRIAIDDDYFVLVEQFLSTVKFAQGSTPPLPIAEFRSGDGPFGTAWNWPWTWSPCAKCELEVNLFITGTVIVAAAAAGTTGPGALAIWSALIEKEYGLMAWKAVEAYIFSEGVSTIAERICKTNGCSLDPATDTDPRFKFPCEAGPPYPAPPNYKWLCLTRIGGGAWHLQYDGPTDIEP